MKLIKGFTILIIIVLSSSFLHAQDRTRKFYADIDYSVYNPYGRIVEYAMIRDKIRYTLVDGDSVNCIVATDSLRNVLSRHCFPKSYGKIWSSFDDDMFLAAIQYQVIYYGPFCQDSTHVADLTEYNHTITLTPIGNYIDSFGKAFLKRDDRYYPSNSIGYKLKKTINIDFDMENKDSLSLYFRDKDSFSIFKIPKINHSGYVNMPGSYGSSNYDKEYPPHKYSEMFSVENSYRDAIKDDLFFEGDFKVIRQNDNPFIFNLQNGRIYVIKEKKIIFIGSLRLTDTNNMATLVEDKDNNEILVTSPVTWIDTECPKPRIRIVIL